MNVNGPNGPIPFLVAFASPTVNGFAVVSKSFSVYDTWLSSSPVIDFVTYQQRSEPTASRLA